MSPFDFWAHIWRNSIAITENAQRLGETMVAAGTVIDSRSRVLRDAAGDPFRADYAEIGRMVPEKVAAFSQAGLAAMGDLQDMQKQILANWWQLGSIALSGRWPTVAEMGAMTARSTRIAKHSVSASSNALAPIHRTATGNARRLKRKSDRA